MPKVRRAQVPEALLRHLLARMRERHISYEQLVTLAKWLDSEPDVPEGKWFRKFPSFTVCGQSEFIKTFLLPGQAPDGREIE
jgi:hypothetical protein